MHSSRAFESDPLQLLHSQRVPIAPADAVMLPFVVPAIVGAVHLVLCFGIHGTVCSLRRAVDEDDVGLEEVLHRIVIYA